MAKGKISRWGVAVLIWLCFAGALLTVPMACKHPGAIFTVGILNFPPDFEPVVEGFKSGMAELGYTKGTIQYVYHGSVGVETEAIDTEIARLLSQNIDLLFTTGNEVTLRAKEVLEGTNIPIVFGSSMMVLEQGIVSDMKHPGERITGVQAVNSIAKTLEWIAVILPGAKQVYLPYNPEDTLSILALTLIDNRKILGNIEIIKEEVYTVEDAIVAIERLPGDVDAVFRIPSPTLDPRNNELSQIAIKRGLPMVSAMPLDDTVLFSFGSDLHQMGKQASRLAYQILLGANPEDLPIENGETYFTINLQTAQKIDVHIPDVVLAQANRVIY